MSDFNSTEFVIGSAKGVRVWRVDSLGRLTGWTHKQVWTPGENIAVCRRTDDAALRTMRSYYCGDEAPAPKPIEPCKEVAASCDCGFWAYHSGTPDFGSSEGVVGIVEGYGKTTVGTKGFRASKARIVALAFPKSSCGCTHDLPFAQTAATEEKVRRNYPDVPTFDSLDVMLAEFPPDKPEVPGPEHPDFWTMDDPQAKREGTGWMTYPIVPSSMLTIPATPTRSSRISRWLP